MRHPADTILTSNPNNSNLNDGIADDVNNANGNDPKQNTTEDGTAAISVDEGDNEKNIDDDQECVIIEEVTNKTIELDEDSGEEFELQLVPVTEAIPTVTEAPLTVTDNSLEKSTEFVVVHAANLAIPVVENSTEPTKQYNAVEDLQIKDELAESVTADLNTNDILENDPMDLLELNTRSESSVSVRSQEDTDYNDDVSSLGSSSVKTGFSSSISVLDWVKDYPWLLYEEGDDPFGYCLYCDAKINVKSQRSVKQHGLSLYHKERCENYLAFREEEEKNGLSVKLIEIKEEFGTDSRVEALKLKRKSQSGSLNNFNWRRWLEEYPWLERNSTEGTVGFCKYCRMHVNVEFSYLRDRHQEGSRHKEAEKHYGESNEPESQIEPSRDDEEEDDESSPTDNNSQTKSHNWLELVKSEPNMVRCKLCGYKMFKNNFLRHLRSNLHENNEKMYVKDQNTAKEQKLGMEHNKKSHNWKIYSESHPWLVADPVQPTLAYCKYCKKRLFYGSSAAKRSLHENSSQHKQNAIEYKKRSRKANDENDSNGDPEQNTKDQVEGPDGGEEGEDQNSENEENNEEDGDEEEDGDNEEENEDKSDDDEEEEDEEEEEEEEEEDVNDGEEVQEEKVAEDDNESKKRITRLSDEWLNQYSWCKKYKKDPKNFMYCIYCNIPLSAAYSRSKHQLTSFHISAEKKFLSRQPNKKQKLQHSKQDNEAVPCYEWAIPSKKNSNSYSCRYCRVRISKHYSKKQHASSKIHQINESLYKKNNNSRKSLRHDDNANTKISQQPQKIETEPSNVAPPTKKVQTFPKVVIKAPSTVTLIKQMQKRFPWLGYKRSELRSHYGHCKICDCSLYIRSLKHALRHLRSGRHISFTKASKQQKVEKDQDDDGDGDGDEKSEKIIKRSAKEELQTSPATTDNVSQNQIAPQALESHKSYNYKSTIAEMKKRFSWIEKSEMQNYAFCRFCNSNIPLKILFLRNHSNSPKHRRSVVNNCSADRKNVDKEPSVTKNTDLDKNDGKCCDVDNDVIIVEDNNEEILISEQDENWTIKSEIMDEHEELDYLLQRSFNNNTINTSNIQRNVRKSVNADNEPSAKRVKRSQSFRRLNDTNSSLVASLLTTPLTLASCLGPLIQQQIQQQANLSQVAQSNYNAATAIDPEAPKIPATPVVEPENTYDLFFKSISETIKKLPVDLAAEGKLRVMQVICDLELQALKRQQSERSESESNNASAGLNYQASPSPSTNVQPVCSSSVTNDANTEQHVNGNETVITQLNSADVAPPSTNNLLPAKVTSANNMEKPTTSSTNSPLIGLMDKNGLQTLQFKTTAVAKQIPRSTASSIITPVANSGIRCIPFKNLSQTSSPDSTNPKITRIQVPINIQNPNSTPNANSVNNSKNLMNFRNIQITKRIGTPPTSAAPATGTQQTVQKTTAIANKSPQRTFLTNIQPQLQRWGCSVNGATTHHNPSSPAVNHLQKLSSQQTSTPISKK